MSYIYMDHAATTPMAPEVVEAMAPYYSKHYENPSSSYENARIIREAMENARKEIAETLHANPEEIYFTSGGTEADNWAIRHAAKVYRHKGMHFITTQMEHHAVLNCFRQLEEEGYEVTYLPIDENGYVRIEDLLKAIRPDTIMISIMYANNEIGTIQPVKEIGDIARKHNILFHTDAVQAYAHERIHVEEENIDMLSASAHKFYGPKGMGFLYCKKSVLLSPSLLGGGQERGMRSGTENVSGIIGMAKAALLSEETSEEENVRKLRDHMIQRILWEIPFSRLNGGRKRRLAGNCNVSFQYIDGAELRGLLDLEGVCVSAGSACSASSLEPSHVLKALHLPGELAEGTIRITLGKGNTMEEVNRVVDLLKSYIQKLRMASPEWELYEKYLPKEEKNDKILSESLNSGMDQ